MSIMPYVMETRLVFFIKSPPNNPNPPKSGGIPSYKERTKNRFKIR